LAAMEIISTFIQSRCMGKMGLKIISTIRTDIFNRLQQLSFEYFDNRPDGKIVVRVTEYINGLADFFSNYVMMFAIYIVKIIVGEFKFSLSVTGVWLEQAALWMPELIERLKKMVATGRVELVAETYYHSMSLLHLYFFFQVYSHLLEICAKLTNFVIGYILLQGVVQITFL